MNLTTALTIIGSFGAASSAQIVNHILTQKREEKKYKKECLQNLYSPSILKLIDLIQYEGYHHCPQPTLRSNFTNKDVLVMQILDNISRNLKYAEADLINNYQQLRNYLDANDPKTVLNDTDDLFVWDQIIELTTVFFNQFIKINKLLKSDSNSINDKLKAPYFFCQFYLLFNTCFAKYRFTDDDTYTDNIIFELYDLIEFILFPINNYTDRIIKIRSELEIVSAKYKDSSRVTEAYTNAYQFFYELADEFSIASEERANEFKDMLDEFID
jgi:hypothetical protein